MYGLYDKEGILRFVDSDKDACIAYAELFELGSTNYCLMQIANNIESAKNKLSQFRFENMIDNKNILLLKKTNKNSH